MVTGGSGFIGSHFVQLLLRKPKTEVESIIIFDKLTYAANMDFTKKIKHQDRGQHWKLRQESEDPKKCRRRRKFCR